MKKIFSLFLALVATTCLFAEGENRVKVGDLYYNLHREMYWDEATQQHVYENVASVTYEEYSSASNYAGLTSAVVPEQIIHDGVTYTVTSIEGYAFNHCASLAAITLPSTLTGIGHSAFYGCSALASIAIPEGVTQIGNDIFSHCSSLASVTLPSTLKSIAWQAFLRCSSLTSIVIPEGAESIEGIAFESCSSLASVTLPSTLQTIGGRAFKDNDALESIVIPEGVTSLGGEAFASCDTLASVTLPSTLKAIGNSAFDDCYALKSVVMAEGIMSIGERAFNDCALTTITIPNSVTSIGAYAFASCHALASVVLPNSLTSLENQVFYGCSSLTSIQLPSTLQKIGEQAFSGCHLMNDVTLPASLQTIGAHAFNNCAAFTTITLPLSLTKIENSAFANIVGLSVYVNAQTPTTIGNNVFSPSAIIYTPDATVYRAAWSEYADRIVDKQYDNWVEAKVAALSDKSTLHMTLGMATVGNLVKLRVEGTINSYDIMMMRNQMPFLRELDLTKAVILATENGYEYTDGYTTRDSILTTQMFTGTGTKIAKIILPTALKHIEAGAFNTNLRELTIHNGTIAESAFRGLNQLTAVNLSNNIRVIPTKAFMECKALQSIALPDSLETIGQEAFRGAGLRTLTIPANVSSIGYGAFANRYYEHLYDRDINYGYYESATATGHYGYDLYGDRYWHIYEYWDGEKYVQEGDWWFELVSLEHIAYTDDNYHGSLQEVIIPENSKLTTIRARVFDGNPNLTKLSLLGKKITTIQDGAFRYCKLDTLILPPNLEKLGTLSFGYCRGLKYIAMPKSLTEINSNAFVGCANLRNVQFPRTLTHIGHHAFADCTNLENADIPGLVRSIGDYAFKDCNVKNVYSYLFDPFTIGQNTFSAFANANATLHIPDLDDTDMKYLYDTQWSQFLYRVRMDKSFTYDDFYAENDIIIGKDDNALTGTPNADLTPGSGLVVEEGDTIQNLGTVVLKGEAGDWASLIAGCNLNVDTLVLQLNVEGKKWHFFGFPFQLKIADIVSNSKFVIYEYDAAIRAERDTTGWKKLPAEQKYLMPGTGYIFNFEVDAEFSIKVSAPDFCKLLGIVDLLVHPSTNPVNQSWNYVSNPYLAYYDIRDLDYTGPITFWDVVEGTYRTMRSGDDEYYLSPYEAFFLQNADNTAATITFDRDKSMTKKQKEEKQNQRHAPAKKAAAPATRALINLTISNGEHSDDTRVVINDAATANYDLGTDAAKFLSTERVPQIFSFDQARNSYAINERPMGEGTIDLGVTIPAGGLYTISCARMDTAFLLLDREENLVHDLQLGEYQFNSGAGSFDSRFALVRQYTPTDVENVENNATIETTKEGLYINGDTHVQIYSVAGVIVAEGQLNGFVPLAAGVYLVNANGTTTKHVIQ